MVADVLPRLIVIVNTVFYLLWLLLLPLAFVTVGSATIIMKKKINRKFIIAFKELRLFYK